MASSLICKNQIGYGLMIIRRKVDGNVLDICYFVSVELLREF